MKHIGTPKLTQDVISWGAEGGTPAPPPGLDMMGTLMFLGVSRTRFNMSPRKKLVRTIGYGPLFKGTPLFQEKIHKM